MKRSIKEIKLELLPAKVTIKSWQENKNLVVYMGSHRVGHNWSGLEAAAAAAAAAVVYRALEEKYVMNFQGNASDIHF